MVLVPGKKYPETGLHKIYGRKSVRITNSPLVFLDISCLGQVLEGVMENRKWGYPCLANLVARACKNLESTCSNRN